MSRNAANLLVGWDDILKIPDEDGRTRNLIDQNGLITLNSIRAHAATYEAAQARNAQNATQMYMFFVRVHYGRNQTQHLE